MDDYVALVCRDPSDMPSDALVCSAPGRNVQQGARNLEVIGAGGSLGAGARMSVLGVDIPAIREAYEYELTEFLRELKRRQAMLQAGDRAGAQELARWAAEQRRSIARTLRRRQGVAPTVLLELRDRMKYGPGGRSYANILRRYRGRDLHGASVYGAMIDGAAAPNAEISLAAVRGARFLKNGGRVVVVISLAATAYVLLTTPEDQLAQVLYEEGGSALLGAAGSGLAVGACLVFGVATGGFGLLACGVVGGLIGGYAGEKLGDKLWYISGGSPIADGDLIDAADLDEEPLMCLQ